MAQENPSFETGGEKVQVHIDYSKELQDLDDDGNSRSPQGKSFMQKFADARDYPLLLISRNPKVFKSLVYLVLFVLYNAFFIGCIVRYVKNDLDFEWCDELGFLIIITSIVYALLFYHQGSDNQIRLFNRKYNRM